MSAVALFVAAPAAATAAASGGGDGGIGGDGSVEGGGSYIGGVTAGVRGAHMAVSPAATPAPAPAPAMSLNFCVTDGRHIVCSRYRNHPRQDPPSLFVLSGAGFACEKEGSCLRLTAAGMSCRVVSCSAVFYNAHLFLLKREARRSERGFKKPTKDTMCRQLFMSAP